MSASEPPGDYEGGGAGGRDYQEVMKIFILDCDDGFIVRAYVKTYQIVCFK